MISSLVSPQQKISDSEKDEDWKKLNVDYWANIALYPNTDILNLYRAANGDLDESEYSYLTNPYGTATNNRPNLKNFPTKLKNYPIIPPILNLLMGEKRKRPIIANVIVNNPDVSTRKKVEEEKILKSYGQQLYINYLNELGYNSEVDTKQLPELEDLLKDFNKSWSDIRAILGQQSLNYIRDNERVESKFIRGFLDWLVTGTVYSYKDAINDDVIYNPVSPKNVGYVADETVVFIEDGEAAAIRLYLTRNEILDRLWDTIQEEDKEDDILNWLDRLSGSRANNSDRAMVLSDIDNGDLRNGFNNNNFNANSQGSNFRMNYTSTAELIYVNWKSWTRIKRINVTNLLGESEIIEVPFEYKESIEDGETLIGSYWVNQVWEGYRIDSKFYIGIRPVKHQRGSVNNPSKCKLLINGRVKKTGDLKALSIVELLMPYQHLYNMIKYKGSLILAKNKEKVMALPLGLLPKEEGWDIFDWMYYVDSTGILFLDETADNIQTVLSAIKDIDLGLGNAIQFMWQIEQQIKADAAELVGITPQRKGDINASAGLGTTETARYTSSLITEDMFAQYDEFQESELNGLLDMSRYAYRNGKKASYLSSEGRLSMLEIDDVTINDYCSSEFGVRVSSASKYEEQKQKLQRYAEAMAQNGAKGSTLGKIITHEDNFAMLLDKLEEIENLESQIEQQQQQADRDNQLQIQQMISADKQADRDIKKYEIDTKANTDIEKALITASAFPDGSEIDVTGLDVNGIEANRLKREELGLNTALKHKEINSKNNIENKKVNAKLQEARLNADVTRENMKNDKEIAQINAKNRAKQSTKK